MSSILITGNPVDGFTFIGPFPDANDATEAGEDNSEGADWWVANLKLPAGYDSTGQPLRCCDAHERYNPDCVHLGATNA